MFSANVYFTFIINFFVLCIVLSVKDGDGTMNTTGDQANQGRIRTNARRFAWVCTILMYALPAAVALYLLLVDTLALAAELYGADMGIADLTVFKRLGGIVIAMIPLTPMILFLAALRRLFRLYALGVLFAVANVEAFRKMGWWMVLFAAAQFVTTPLASVWFSWDNPPGERALSIEISSGMVTAAVIGGVVVVIARVMDEARRLQDEQALTV